MVMETSQSLMNDSFCGWQKIVIPRYHECVAWFGAYLLSHKSVEVLAKEKLTDHFACHQCPPLQYVGGASESISFDLGNRSANSSFNWLFLLQKPCKNSLRRSSWDFGSRMLNIPARFSSIKKTVIFTYQSPFGKPSFMLWIIRKAARSATATSSGLMQTIGPARVS
jgi:hypothetical protein